MESLYKQILNGASMGKAIKINLKDKTLKMDRTTLIDKGISNNDTPLITKEDLINFGIENLLEVEPYALISAMYRGFKHSVPSKANDGHTSYFKALNADELSDEELVINLSRNVAQVMLEGYILLASLSGLIKWPNEKHWFWQGSDRDLVILKEWI